MVELTDFGLAKQTSDNNDTIEQVGTLICMAPEIIQMSSQTTCKVDSWSLGVVLYEMLTGNLPFYGKDNCELEYRICFQDLNIDEQLGNI